MLRKKFFAAYSCFSLRFVFSLLGYLQYTIMMYLVSTLSLHPLMPGLHYKFIFVKMLP